LAAYPLAAYPLAAYLSGFGLIKNGILFDGLRVIDLDRFFAHPCACTHRKKKRMHTQPTDLATEHDNDQTEDEGSTDTACNQRKKLSR
jgi:hypothetical protein